MQPKAYDRFLQKTNKNGPIPTHKPELGACWIWNGARRPKGYGTFMWNGKVGSVHRYSHIVHIGPIPEAHDVMHKCDNPPCVNPSHFTTGTRKQNMEDCVAKGRQMKGERYGSGMTEARVLEMRRLYDSGVTIKDIMAKFALGRGVVSHIVHRDRWKHLP